MRLLSLIRFIFHLHCLCILFSLFPTHLLLSLSFSSNLIFAFLLFSAEVLLASLYCGLCGTDLHLLHSGDVGGFILEKPLIIGHEATAKVISVGSNVKSLQPGDIVTCEPAIPCSDCTECRAGHYNWCQICNKQAKGLPQTNGFLTRYFKHPISFCYKIPATVDAKVGALCEPLAVIVHAIRRCGLTLGARVLVTGAGTMGLLALLVAKAYGARSVAVADINVDRLSLAKELGADWTLELSRQASGIETGKRVKEQFGSVDICLECTGAESCTQMSIEAAKFGGKVVAIGLGPTLINVPLATASLKEIDLIGVCRFAAGCFELAVHLVKTLPVERIVSHVFALEKINEAFTVMGRGEGVKILVQCTPEPSRP